MNFINQSDIIEGTLSNWMAAVPLFVFSGLSGMYTVAKATEKAKTQIELTLLQRDMNKHDILPTRKFDVNFNGKEEKIGRIKNKIHRMVSWKELGQLSLASCGSALLGLCTIYIISI